MLRAARDAVRHAYRREGSAQNGRDAINRVGFGLRVRGFMTPRFRSTQMLQKILLD